MEFTLTGELAGFLAGDGVTASYSRTAGETVAGGPYTISATLAPEAVLGNYTITYNTAPFTITKAAAVVNVSGFSGEYDGSAHGATGTVAAGQEAHRQAPEPFAAGEPAAAEEIAAWAGGGGRVPAWVRTMKSLRKRSPRACNAPRKATSGLVSARRLPLIAAVTAALVGCG